MSAGCCSWPPPLSFARRRHPSRLRPLRPHAWPPGPAAPPARSPATAIPKLQAPRLNNPVGPVQRFLSMTPEEQQRVMEKATPQVQRQLQQALDRFNSRPPAQRARLLQQYQALATLSPQQQVLVGRQIAAFNHLPEDRIKPVRQELLRLLRMPPDERSTRFVSEDFSSRYSPAEQQILKDLSGNLPFGYPLAGR